MAAPMPWPQVSSCEATARGAAAKPEVIVEAVVASTLMVGDHSVFVSVGVRPGIYMQSVKRHLPRRNNNC